MVLYSTTICRPAFSLKQTLPLLSETVNSTAAIGFTGGMGGGVGTTVVVASVVTLVVASVVTLVVASVVTLVVTSVVFLSAAQSSAMNNETGKNSYDAATNTPQL